MARITDEEKTLALEDELNETQTTETPSDPPADKPADPPTEGDGKPADGGGEPEQVLVTIGEPKAEDEDKQDEPAPEWIKELRNTNRELRRRTRELEEQVAAAGGDKSAGPGAKPTLEAHDYDTDKYEAALAAWYDKKRVEEAAAQKKRDAEEALNAQWRKEQEAYGKARETFAQRVRDYDEAEATVNDTLSPIQAAIIVRAAEDPAKVIYGLGTNPAEVRRLAAITDPIKFTSALVRLEDKMKVTPRKPQPEKLVTGGGRLPDTRLEKLHEKARSTGDYTEYLAAKRAQKKSA